MTSQHYSAQYEKWILISFAKDYFLSVCKLVFSIINFKWALDEDKQR